MKRKNENRTKWLGLRLTEQEHELIQKLARQSDCRTPADYVRKMAMGKPIIMRYRNQSLDDYLAQMMPLRNSLDNIGNAFVQMVRRFHTLHHIPDIQQWIILNEQEKTVLFRQIETISNKIDQTYLLWSRE